MTDSRNSSFDKNLRSLLDAVAMFEREAGMFFDRLGFDSDAVGRTMDLIGTVSAEAVRPLAAALGIADAAAVEALARDVRALLQSEARHRREQAATTSRLDDLLAAVEELGTTTARLAELQARTQDRVDALAERTEALDAREAERRRMAEQINRLSERIDDLESTLSADGLLPPLHEGEGEAADAPPVRPGAKPRPPRIVSSSPGSQKILEGLPTVEPKMRPA